MFAFATLRRSAGRQAVARRRAGWSSPSARSSIRSSSRRELATWSFWRRSSSSTRKYSSAMLSAARTAIFSVSPAGRLAERQPHLLVDVRGQLGDVRRIERAADRVPLPVDLDGGRHGTRAVPCRLAEFRGSSICCSISPTRERISARSSRSAVSSPECLPPRSAGPRPSSSRVSRVFSSAARACRRAAARSCRPAASAFLPDDRSVRDQRRVTATFAKDVLLCDPTERSVPLLLLCSAAVRAAERLDDPFGRRLHLVVGQRAIRRAERQPKRQADAAFRNALALIPIELCDRHERGRGRRTDSATNGSGRQGFIDEDRDVADDRRKARQRLARAGRRRRQPRRSASTSISPT